MKTLIATLMLLTLSMAAGADYNIEAEPLPSKKWREVIVEKPFIEVITILERKVYWCWNQPASLILSAGSRSFTDIDEENGQAEFIRKSVLPSTVNLRIRVYALSNSQTQVMTRSFTLFGKNRIMKEIAEWLNGSTVCDGPPQPRQVNGSTDRKYIQG